MHHPRQALRCLADLPDQSPDWVWPGRISCGALSLLVGDPGVGKSLVTLDIAARLTARLPWPDGRPAAEPADVLLLSAEDSIHRTVRSRLLAMGADLSRIRYLKTGDWLRSEDPSEPATHDSTITASTAFGGQPTYVVRSIEQDAYHLTAALSALPECRLVIIDPIPAYLERLGADRPEVARKALLPLAALAQRSGAAIVAVAHRDQLAPRRTAQGAGHVQALAAMARVIHVVKPDSADRARRVFQPLKNNLADDSTALAFHIAGNPAGAAVLKWLDEPIDVGADELAGCPDEREPPPRRRTQFDRAVAWLEGALAAGPVLSPELAGRAAEAGINDASLRRARTRLGVCALRQTQTTGGGWLCALPLTHAQSPDQGAQNFDVNALHALRTLNALPTIDEVLSKALGPNHPASRGFSLPAA